MRERSAVSTYRLVDIVQTNRGLIVEASLLLNGGLRSTHFLECGDECIFDSGCAGEQIALSLADFLAIYIDASWTIDQIC